MHLAARKTYDSRAQPLHSRLANKQRLCRRGAAATESALKADRNVRGQPSCHIVTRLMSNRQKNKRHREEVSRPPGNMSQQKTPTAVITSQLCPEAEYTCHIRAYQQQNQNYYGNSLPPRGSGATGPVRAQAGHLVSMFLKK